MNIATAILMINTLALISHIVFVILASSRQDALHYGKNIKKIDRCVKIAGVVTISLTVTPIILWLSEVYA